MTGASPTPLQRQRLLRGYGGTNRNNAETTQEQHGDIMSRLSNKEIKALVQGMPVVQEPEVDVNDTGAMVSRRALLQLQEKVRIQDRCIRDLSRAITLMQQRMYALSGRK